MKKSTLSYICVILTVLTWGTLAPVSKLLIQQCDSLFVLFSGSLIASVILFVILLLKHKISRLYKYSVHQLLHMILLGILGYYIYTWLYLKGISYLTSIQAMIINYFWPSMVIIFSCILYKERFTIKRLISILLAIAGVIVVAGNGSLTFFNTCNPIGVIFCILAAISYGLYSAVNKYETYDKEIGIFIAFSVTTVISGIEMFLFGSLPYCTTELILGLLYNGIVVKAIGSTLWIVALQFGKTSVVSNLAYLTPFVSLLFSAILLHETIAPIVIVGLIFIVLSIMITIKDFHNNY